MRFPALLAAAGLALTTLAPAAPLIAQVKLAASTPKQGTKAKGTKVVTLTFSEKVNPAKASANIVMTAMPGMKDHPEMLIRNFTPSWSADGKTMTLTLKKPLPAGTYDVRWQAAGADGRVMTGKVSFDVS
ncbi:copper resistance protein CopC [Erythrobacter donghaensis]|jgi:methionine-rich copper-binding protein CopC|uniref:copper resistance protein CopC n=1 Tax=Erythrobacter donghaensis TaxID=267135 RepID=UPI000939F8D2|nr:copper resistance protein CopC [Erythrobacter donghaensis]